LAHLQQGTITEQHGDSYAGLQLVCTTNKILGGWSPWPVQPSLCQVWQPPSRATIPTASVCCMAQMCKTVKEVFVDEIQQIIAIW